MPELPEVETVRRLLSSCLKGQTLAQVRALDDPIVFQKKRPAEVESFLTGRKLEEAGRKGKTFWLQLDQGVLLGHLGMSGWVRSLGQEKEKRLISHGKAALDTPEGEPKFLKLLLQTERDDRIALTDGRRLARVWMAEEVESDPKVAALGPDAFLHPRSGEDLHESLGRRKAPIKALLLDQKQFAGVGNWVADECLYHARLAPHRPAHSLSRDDWEALADALKMVLKVAVECEADENCYPEGWLMKHRWGGARGASTLDGRAIQRDEVGGRTSAWVPEVQK